MKIGGSTFLNNNTYFRMGQATKNNSDLNTEINSTSKSSHKVYLKSDEMVYSGGNGTGLSFYIKYADESTEENPIVKACGIDENGDEFEQTININDINPRNATIVEMRALEAHIKADKGNGLSSFSPGLGNVGLNERVDFIKGMQSSVEEMNLMKQTDTSKLYSSNLQKYYSFYQAQSMSELIKL